MKKIVICVIAILLPMAPGFPAGNRHGETCCPAKDSPLSFAALSRHHLKAGPRAHVDNDELRDQGILFSNNWSGYVSALDTLTADSVSTVAGTWQVPSVTSTAGTGNAAYSAVWVGIDGLDDGTVEQIGTMQGAEVFSEGKGKTVTATAYYAWVEMYPAESLEITEATRFGKTVPATIKPGDTITAKVSCVGDKFTFTMSDMTAGWTYTGTAATATPERMTAEWIVEAPADETGQTISILPLADFSKVSFTACSATIDNLPGPIDGHNFAWEKLIMQTSGGVVKAGPTVFTDNSGTGLGASSFSVSWNHD